MSLPDHAYALRELSPKSYEHPADRAATAALGQIPMLDTVVRKLIELGYERAMRQAYLGSSVRIGERQLPDVWTSWRSVVTALDLGEPPDVYLTQFPIANAMTIGAEKPIVVLNSELVTLLDAEQLRAVLAHEAGHILSEHVLYATALAILMRLGSSVRLPVLAGVPLAAVRAALLEWYRAAELSCDRAAAIVVRDPIVVARTLMTVAGGAAADRLDLDAFMQQGLEYREPPDALQRISRLLLDLNVTHPMPVRRIHELMTWVQGGDFDRIVGGEYRKRTDPVDPRVESGDAVDHYADRFRAIFAEAGGVVTDAGQKVGDAGQKLADWIRDRATPIDDTAGDGPTPDV